MKKRFISMVLALAMCLPLCTAVFAEEDKEEFREGAVNDTWYEMNQVELKGENRYYFSDAGMAGNGTRAGGDGYIRSYYEYNTHKVLVYNSKPLVKDTFLGSVAQGQTTKIKSKVSITDSISFLTTAENELKNAVSTKVGANSAHQVTIEVEKEEEFTFPPNASGNSASFYLAVGFDKCRFTFDRYDVYLGSGVGGGMGVGSYTVKNGSRTITADIPKKLIYSKTTTY